MDIIIQLAVVLFAISLHESAHGWMADKLGDPTARLQGRITLNPIAHIDPVGTVIFPAICAIIGAPVFGWAKPVQFNPYNLRNPRKDEMLIGAAGPVSNLITAAAAITAFLLFRSAVLGVPLLARVLLYSIIINIYLMIFNLIPVPPLDGSKILKGFLRSDALVTYYKIEPYGFIILILLIFTGGIDLIARPIFNFIFKLLFF